MSVGDILDHVAGAKSTKQSSSVTSTQIPQAHQVMSRSLRRIVSVAVAVIVIGISFYLGTVYQRDHQPAVATASTGNSSQQYQQSQNGSGFGGYGHFGHGNVTPSQVTAVSSSSITVQNSTSGNTTTYAITSSTTVTDQDQQVTISDIQVGDTVIVIPDQSNTSNASRIIVNPSFGGQSAPTDSDNM